MLIADLEALLAKATPGEWRVQDYDRNSRWSRFTVISAEGIIANVDEGRVEDLRSNSELIAATHNALPAILTALRAADIVVETENHGGSGMAIRNAIFVLRLALAALGEGPREAQRSLDAMRSHKWTGCQQGGSPTEAGTYEWVRYCSVCGMEDTCEDPLPPCPGEGPREGKSE